MRLPSVMSSCPVIIPSGVMHDNVCPYIMSTSAAAVHLLTNRLLPQNIRLWLGEMLCGSSLCKVFIPRCTVAAGENRGEAVRRCAQWYGTLPLNVGLVMGQHDNTYRNCSAQKPVQDTRRLQNVGHS